MKPIVPEVTHRLADALVQLGPDVTVFNPCTEPNDVECHYSRVASSESGRTVKWPPFAAHTVRHFTGSVMLHLKALIIHRPVVKSE